LFCSPRENSQPRRCYPEAFGQFARLPITAKAGLSYGPIMTLLKPQASNRRIGQ
jgi:hypothetical protein